jgi:hypothetical protein
MILTGENRRTRRRTCPSATLPTTNPTWIDPGANSGLRGERPATNDLSHGTASWCVVTMTNSLDVIYRPNFYKNEVSQTGFLSPSSLLCWAQIDTAGPFRLLTTRRSLNIFSAEINIILFSWGKALGEPQLHTSHILYNNHDTLTR